jgi:hypothetical protein
MVGDIITTVTEAKREDINQGIAQNAVQLQASLQRNRKKTSYDDALHEDVMYGIVSTGKISLPLQASQPPLTK